MPPASGWYAEWPFSGLSQTMARDLRCRVAIDFERRVVSPRSHPSDAITTIAPRVIPRRP